MQKERNGGSRIPTTPSSQGQGAHARQYQKGNQTGSKGQVPKSIPFSKKTGVPTIHQKKVRRFVFKGWAEPRRHSKMCRLEGEGQRIEGGHLRPSALEKKKSVAQRAM